MVFVRWESPEPNARGARVGVFGLANGLARAGRLSPADHAWWRAANDWFDAAYTDPASVDASLFDRSRYPVVSCWFRASAGHLTGRVPGYLTLLDRYGVAWTERRSTDPGVVRYSDDDQIVVTPYRT